MSEKFDSAIQVRAIIFPNGAMLGYDEATGEVGWRTGSRGSVAAVPGRTTPPQASVPPPITLPDAVGAYGAAERQLPNELKGKFNELLIAVEDLRAVILSMIAGSPGR